jgi:ornithine cyclodeaminase/alanine dehydrogenase-like protein (mu-crystallin family)
MLILTRGDVEALLTMQDALEAVEEAFRMLSAGDVVMPQRTATPIAEEGGLHLAMPAYVRAPASAAGAAAARATLAIKVVTVYPQNPQRHGLPMVQGALLLHDAATGALLALMDAEALTTLRTGAAAGVATRLLALPHAATLLMIGAGALAFPVVQAICAVRPISQILVHSRTGRRDGELCAAILDRLGVQATPIAAAELPGAVAKAQIICTATTSEQPLFDGNLLQPGTHINALGAYRATMREVDATAIFRSRVLVDSRLAAAGEAGDILQAMAEQPERGNPVAGEVREALLGAIAGRTTAEEITLFKSVGLAVQDATTAARIYAAALAAGVGRVMDLAAH